MYVATNGSDTAAGTAAAPWRTIGKGLASAGSGQTVYVRAGTYPEGLTFSRTGITLAAYPGEKPTVTGRLKITASNVKVSGFKFQGGTSANPSDVAVYVSGADNVEFSNNEIVGAAMSAIYVGDPGNGSDNFRFLSNYVHDNGTHADLDHGIYCGTARGALIANNLFERNLAYGIHIYPDCDNAVITQNTVVGNGRSGIIVGGESTTADANIVVNNIVAFNADYGVRAYWGGPTGSGNVIRDNLLFGNPDGDLASGTSAAGLAYSNNVVADPLFVNRAGGDYRLSAASPAVGRAVDAYSQSTDLTGASRPAGAADLGAYER